MSEKVRLQKFLAQCGIASRRKSEELILEGAVKVNGKVVTTLGTKIDPNSDTVSFDGKTVRQQDFVYVVLNKPKACITSMHDPQGRRTVMEFVPNLPPGVVPVGRLDFYSEGVLLFTNDGELSARLQAPKYHVEKTYHVKIRGNIDDKRIERLRVGVPLGGGIVTKAAQVDRIKKTQSRHDWLVITLIEGRSRQIHRMLEVLGLTVTKLQRVSYGVVQFHGLRVGDARELTLAEVNQLRNLTKLGKSDRNMSRGSWDIKREETEDSRRAKDRERTIPTPNKTPGGSKKGNAKLRQKFIKTGKAPKKPKRIQSQRNKGRKVSKRS